MDKLRARETNLSAIRRLARLLAHHAGDAARVGARDLAELALPEGRLDGGLVAAGEGHHAGGAHFCFLVGWGEFSKLGGFWCG